MLQKQGFFSTLFLYRTQVNLTDYFAKKVKILHEEIEYSLRENLVLMNLRNTLLPKLLSGEISVSSFQEDTND